jgi:hypothetical protein
LRALVAGLIDIEPAVPAETSRSPRFLSEAEALCA